MALPDTLLARLIETVHEHQLSGDFIMLGRQRWVGTRKGKSAKLLKETLETYLPGLSEENLQNPDDIYTETFFKALGFDRVESMDISEFEGASVIQDLTDHLAPSLVERFDVVYDGGTCEHIFNLPKAYENIDKMIKPGGVLIGHSPCNNWINHSFYQINPEMVYGFWEKAMGYEVLQLILQPPSFIFWITVSIRNLKKIVYFHFQHFIGKSYAVVLPPSELRSERSSDPRQLSAIFKCPK